MSRNLINITRFALVVSILSVLSADMSFSTTAVPRVDTCLQRVGAQPFGPVEAVEAKDQLVFFGSGAAFVVADVSDTSSPSILGSVFLPGTVEHIVIDGNRAVVWAFHAGLRVIDISNPAAPEVLGSYSTGPHDAFRQFEATNGHAFVWDENELVVLDLSQTGNLAKVGQLPMPRPPVTLAADGGILVAAFDEDHDNHILVIDDEGLLSVLDLSDPTHPSLATSAMTADRGEGVAFSSNLLYVANKRAGLSIYRPAKCVTHELAVVHEQ